MKFFTIATHDERLLSILKKSAKIHNIDLTVIGQNKKFVNYGIKLIWFMEYIRNIPGDELVVFLDGYDCIILTDQEEFRNKFHQINNNESDPKKKGLIFSNGKLCLKYNLGIEVNSGMVMGYCSKFYNLLDKICSKYKCNKEGSCDYLLDKYRGEFILENTNNLFYNHYVDGPYKNILTKKSCKNVYDVANKRVRVKNKNNKYLFPCVIHFPKNSFNHKLISDLGYDISNMKYNPGMKYLITDFYKHYYTYLWEYYLLIILIITVVIIQRNY